MRLHLSRRGLLGCACCAGVSTALGLSSAAVAAGGSNTTVTADEALQRLKEGNDLFVADKLPVLDRNHERRLEIARGQSPFAVLVSCSDSRVPPELLFGRGLGDLFIVRNAGNTVDTVALGSIEYAVAELGVPLILVLGHSRCGAVQAAVEAVTKGTNFPGSIGQMIEPIIPAVLAAQRKGGDLVDNAVRENVSRVAARLRTASEPSLMGPLQAKTLRVVGARYSLDDGDVDFFDEG